MKIMLHKTKIGVCLDHSIAYLLEEKNEEKVITIIQSEAAAQNEIEASEIQEGTRDTSFYKKVYDIVRDFDKVSLFGTETAKKELIGRLKADRLYNIEILNPRRTSSITENQKIRFINEYFES